MCFFLLNRKQRSKILTVNRNVVKMLIAVTALFRMNVFVIQILSEIRMTFAARSVQILVPIPSVVLEPNVAN